MQEIKFTFDKKGYAYDYTPTLESDDVPERGVFYCIHDNKGRIGEENTPFAVSLFDTDNPEADTFETLSFRNFESVVRFLRAIGVTFDTESLAVREFLGKANRDNFR